MKLGGSIILSMYKNVTNIFCMTIKNQILITTEVLSSIHYAGYSSSNNTCKFVCIAFACSQTVLA